MKQPSRQNHRNNRNNKGGRRSSGGGGGSSGGAHSANRVYDSSGPEGKVRGTAQQIIDKYMSLARDAQTSGEGVLAENFFQHAEHYQRILTTIQAAEAEERERRQAAQLADQERRAEQQARQQQNRPAHGGNEQNRQNGEHAATHDGQPTEQSAPVNENVQAHPADAAQPDAQPETASSGPALVETPEAKRAEEREVAPRPARRARSKPTPAPVAEAPADVIESAEPADSAVAEAAPKPKRGRPRKPPTPPAEEADATS